jgi:hypothetical protein
MSPEVSRRIAGIIGRHFVTPLERDRILAAAQGVEIWDGLPSTVRTLLGEIEKRGAVA